MAEELDYGIEKSEFINSLTGDSQSDRNTVFKKRYWKKVGVKTGDNYSLDATFNMSGVPRNVYGKHLGIPYEGSISFLENGLGGSRLPDNAELRAAYIVFSRPIAKQAPGSVYVEISQGSDAFQLEIPFAIGSAEGEGKNIRVDIGKSDLPKIANMLKSGKGSKIFATLTCSGEIRDSTYLLFFQSSASYAKDANGQENSRKLHLHFSYWYDPIDEYGNSSVHFDNQRATACDPTDANIMDQNCFSAHILPFSNKYNKNIFHKITWYTTPQNSDEYFHYFDKDGTSKVAKEYSILWYTPEKTELDLRFPAPDVWCYAWPDSTVGWAFFKMETWYRYSLQSDGSFVEKPPVVKLGEFGPQQLIIDTPAYAKPVISLATIGISPVDLPFQGAGMNELSKTWIEDYGAYVAGFCNVDLEIEEASGIFGSTIQRYTIMEDTYRRIKKTLTKVSGSIGNDERATTSIPQIQISGDIAFTVYAHDTRGRTSDPVYFTVKDGFYHVDLHDQTEDGFYAKDDEGNELFHQGIHIIPYMTPSFDFAAVTRVNDNGDISENGTNINIEASPLYSPVPNILTGVNVNRPHIYFDYSPDNGVTWYPASGPIDISSQYQSYFYGTPDTTFYPSITTYQIRLFLYDEMTKYIQEQFDLLNAQNETQADPYQYAYRNVQKIGDGQCTVCLKRDGLGLSIGMMPETDRNLRCIEISENWEIRHGTNGEQIYYIPDVVFTPAGYQRPPKKRKGRIWLQEINSNDTVGGGS